MPQLTVETTDPEVINGNNTLIQNLGPGTLYVGPGVEDTTDGIRVLAGQALLLGAVSTVQLVASGSNCDVRLLPGAVSIQSVEDAPA